MLQFGVTETVLMFLLTSVIQLQHVTAVPYYYLLWNFGFKTVACVFVDEMLVPVDMSYIL